MDHCKGCTVYHNTGCSYGNYNKGATCPCTKCIVKKMCRVSCDAYDEWSDYAYYDRTKELKL